MATKLRLTALSISSMHMNITSGLRRSDDADGADAEQHGGEHEVVGRRDDDVGDHDRPLRRPGPTSLAAGEHDRAGDGDDQQHRRQLEGEHVVAEQVVGELADVGVVAGDRRRRRRPGRRRQAGADRQRRRVAGRHDGSDEQADDADAHHGGERALDRDRVDAQVLGLVDAEQHDHEQEQHDDRAGVDDHLHGGEEVGLHRHEVHGDPEQRQHEAQRGVHRVPVHARRRTPHRAPSPRRR